MGPLEQVKPWQTSGIEGVSRFLDRVWNVATGPLNREPADYDLRDIGGPRGYERGDRPAREYFAVLCSSCGNQAQVPFKPRMDRPVYCSDCFRTRSAS